MKKFEVNTFEIEIMRASKNTNANEVIEAYNEKTDQNPYLVKKFDTLEEARNFYNTIKLDTPHKFGSGYNSGYLFEGKFIEEVEYNEDDEFEYSNGWWNCDVNTNEEEEESDD